MYEENSPYKTMQDRVVEESWEKNLDSIKRAYIAAFKDSRDLGFGFIVVNRDKWNKKDANIRPATWIDVEKCLRVMGVRGAVKEFHSAKNICVDV